MLCKLDSLYSHHIPLVLHEVHSSCVSLPESLCLPPFLISVWRMETMFYSFLSSYAYPDGSEAKSPANAGDMGLIPGWGRSPGGGNGNLLQYSCLENPMNRRTWWATVHRVAESDMTEPPSRHLWFQGVESVSH